MTEQRTRKEQPDSDFDDWVKVIDRVPYVGSVKRDLLGLRRLLIDRRAPRIAAIGASESGRTELANALLSAKTFGEGGAAPAPAPGNWVRIDADGRKLDWLELPSDDEARSLMEQARRAFEESIPDILVGTLEATAAEETAKDLQTAIIALRNHLDTEHAQKTAIVIVVTKCDELEPLSDAPPQKLAMIDTALEQIRKRVAGLGIKPGAVLGVSALPRVDIDTPIGRWNVANVGEAIVARLPDSAQLEAVRAFEVGREARREVGRALINSASALALTVGLAPIPFADAFILLPLQALMVTGIAYLSGRPWDRRVAVEWIASVGVIGGAGMGLRWGAQQLVKMIPGAGTIVGASVAGAGTLAIGRSALAYFIDGPGRLSPRPELLADNPA